MALASTAVGQSPAALRTLIDARWLMAYAAGLGRTDEAYLDTTRPGGVVGHPVFPVGPEWALLNEPDRNQNLRLGLRPDETPRSVHAGHDLILHQAVRQNMKVTLRIQVAGVERKRPGALLTLRFDAVDIDGAPVWTTWMRSLYRGVEVSGPDVPPADAPEPPVVPDSADGLVAEHCVALGAGTAHVYTECARIWNPIHTDRKVAHAVGLQDTILHGTATLAHGVSAAMDHLGARPEQVRRLGGSFRAMVPLPSRITVRLGVMRETGDGKRTVSFEVRNHAGDTAVRDGFVVVGP
jgi:acyl dehydratase